MEKKDLLDRWLNGELTSEEFEIFKKLPEYSSYLKIDRFVKNIELPVHDADLEISELRSKAFNTHRTQRKPKVVTLRNLMRIAAILTVLLASSYFILNYNTTHQTTIASSEIISLPDASKVTLNETSELDYKKNLWWRNRSLSLQGEAFFEVEKGSTFTVATELGTVEVVGTQFSVLARDGKFVVKCYEGMVEVTRNDLSVALPAGRSARLTSGDLQLGEVHTVRPGWVFNESRFDDVAIMHVLAELELQYSLAVTTENIDVNLRFTGGFPNDDLDAALQAISIPLNLNYRIDDKDAVTLFGTSLSE